MLNSIKTTHQAITHRRRFISITLSALLCLSPLAAYSAEMHDIRGKRYCELIVAKNRWTVFVYNSFGLNECPAKVWNKISIEGVTKETNASWVKLNGPRYWVIDGVTNSSMLKQEPKILGGMAMREAGVLHLGLPELIKGAKPYLTHTVHRHTNWVFHANSRVYELINPKGEVYVMQSYSVQKVAQTERSLQELGSQLTLPAGWHFKTGLLKTTKNLPAINDKAIVIQDNFSNTYQLASNDLLTS